MLALRRLAALPAARRALAPPRCLSVAAARPSPGSSPLLRPRAGCGCHGAACACRAAPRRRAFSAAANGEGGGGDGDGDDDAAPQKTFLHPWELREEPDGSWRIIKQPQHENQLNRVRKNYVRRAKLRRLRTEKAARKRKKLARAANERKIAKTNAKLATIREWKAAQAEKQVA